MAATTDDARARADDPALAAASGFSFARRSSPGHLAALVLGGVLVLAGAVGFGPIAAWASAGGDGAGWVAPVVLLVVGGRGGYIGRDGHMVDPEDEERRRAFSAGEEAVIRRLPE